MVNDNDKSINLKRVIVGKTLIQIHTKVTFVDSFFLFKKIQINQLSDLSTIPMKNKKKIIEFLLMLLQSME